MLKVRWTTPAADDFERNQNHYQALNPHATLVMATRVQQAIQNLCTAPQIGRKGVRVGTREWVVVRTPYIVVYRVSAELLEILHVFHERADWTNATD